MNENQTNIFDIPDEVIALILANSVLSCKDVLNFGETCSKYNILIKNNQCFWKQKTKNTVLPDVYNVVKNTCEDWFSELKAYLVLKSKISSELLQMSSKFYGRKGDIYPDDIKNVFELATSGEISYFCTVCILSDILKKGSIVVYDSPNPVESLYTLTNMHYIKVTLRFLIHTLLTIKWRYMHEVIKPPPEQIVHFFLQWVDTTRIHSERKYNDKINELVGNVENLLKDNHPLKSVKRELRQEWAQDLIDDNIWDVGNSLQILAATRKVIYQQKHMAVTAEATIENLDIMKVMNTRYANAVLVLSIFAAVTRRCGVRCDLIAFPDHLFLEWKESFFKPSQAYHINHINGELEKKRQCPFATNNTRRYKYNPVLLLHYLYSSYAKSMGALKDWSIQNALYLAGFLHYINDNVNPYKHFLEYLESHDLIVFYKLRKFLDFECMKDYFYKDILALVNLKCRADKSCRQFQPKIRPSCMKFAVGMICYHLKYDYICIIRDWDPICVASASWQQRMAINDLEHGSSQPFYTVIAADYSNRYVAQENLRIHPNPPRLYMLEEVVAREFSHFDGFMYVPNRMKDAEYPEDGAVRNLYRMRHEIQRSASVDAVAGTSGNGARAQQQPSTV